MLPVLSPTPLLKPHRDPALFSTSDDKRHKSKRDNHAPVVVPSGPPNSMSHANRIFGTIWAPDDDRVLENLCHQFPFNWQLISDSFNTARRTLSVDRRSPWDCYQRWNKMWNPHRKDKDGEADKTAAEGSTADAGSALDHHSRRSSKLAAAPGPPSLNGIDQKHENSKKKLRHAKLWDAMRRTAKRRDKGPPRTSPSGHCRCPCLTDSSSSQRRPGTRATAREPPALPWPRPSLLGGPWGPEPAKDGGRQEDLRGEASGLLGSSEPACASGFSAALGLLTDRLLQAARAAAGANGLPQNQPQMRQQNHQHPPPPHHNGGPPQPHHHPLVTEQQRQQAAALAAMANRSQQVRQGGGGGPGMPLNPGHHPQVTAQQMQQHRLLEAQRQQAAANAGRASPSNGGEVPGGVPGRIHFEKMFSNLPGSANATTPESIAALLAAAIPDRLLSLINSELGQSCLLVLSLNEKLTALAVINVRAPHLPQFQTASLILVLRARHQNHVVKPEQIHHARQRLSPEEAARKNPGGQNGLLMQQQQQQQQQQRMQHQQHMQQQQQQMQQQQRQLAQQGGGPGLQPPPHQMAHR